MPDAGAGQETHRNLSLDVLQVHCVILFFRLLSHASPAPASASPNRRRQTDIGGRILKKSKCLTLHFTILHHRVLT
jgi:hypothetical protein